ncbi:hypothetical protein [Rhizobium sp. BR 249]|uniref:hypothetical protein n=1 Tax=Rhizobium sp. BR 249 TaxID=3040011 RepID=UPI0039BF65FA
MNIQATTVQNFQATLLPSATGLPTSTGTIPTALQPLLQTGNGAQQFFAQQNFAANLITDVNSGVLNWIADTDDNGNPMYFTAIQDGNGNSMYLEVTTSQAPASQPYTAPDGQSYDVIGSFHATLSWNDDTMWDVNVPLGITSGLGALLLEYYAWSSFIKPVLEGVLSGIKSLCSAASDCVSAGDVAAASTAAESSSEVAGESIGEGATISMTAGACCFAGAALLIALPFILSAIEHPTGQSVKVYNLTPYTLTWQAPYTDDCSMTQFPVLSDGSNNPDYTIAAPSVITPPGGQSVTTYHEGDFAFQSTSNLKGISWAMQFAFTDDQNNTQGTAAVMFDLPLLKANSLAGEWTSGELSANELQEWAETNYGILSETQFVTSDTNGLVMTLTYNALSGQQPLPSDPDEEGYVYASAIVFQLTS